MWRFLFYQGLRPGEMYELRIRNVGLEAGEIQIGDPDWRQKSGQEDVIPLLPPGRFYARPFISGDVWIEPPSRKPSDRLFDAGRGEAPDLGEPAPASQPSADHDGVRAPRWRGSTGYAGLSRLSDLTSESRTGPDKYCPVPSCDKLKRPAEGRSSGANLPLQGLKGM